MKRFEKKQKEQQVEFFRGVSFLKGLSNLTIMKLTFSFTPVVCETAGKYIFREGEPVTHCAIIKEGEFDIVKKNLKGID